MCVVVGGGEGGRGGEEGKGRTLTACTATYKCIDTKATVTTKMKNRQKHTSEHGELWCIVIGVQDANSDVGRVFIEGRSSVSGSHEERVGRSGLIVQCLRRGREDR